MSEIDGRKIGEKGTPITDRIAKLYDQAVHGKVKRYLKWLTPV